MAKSAGFVSVENEYNQMISTIVGIVGQDYFNQFIASETKKARQAFGSYAYKNSGDLFNETDVLEQAQFRNWAAQSSGLAAGDRAISEAFQSVVGDMVEELEKAAVMEHVLTSMSGYFTDQVMDYRVPKAKKQEMEDLAIRIDDVRAQIGAFKVRTIPVKKYGGVLIDAMLGNHEKEVALADSLAADREAWYAHLKANGYDSPKEMSEIALNAEAPKMTSAYMDIQSFDSGFGAAFAQAVENKSLQGLTEEYRAVAAQNFDLMVDTMFDKRQKRAFKENGVDVFDFVFVDGKSMNELYAEKYADKPYYASAEWMKCEFMAEALSGKTVEIYTPDKKSRPLLPLQIHSDMPEIKAMAESAEMTVAAKALDNRENIKNSLAALAARQKEEVVARKVRMVNDQAPEKMDLEVIEKSSVFTYDPIFTNKRGHDAYLSARVPEGKMSEHPNLSGCSSQFDYLAASLGHTGPMKSFFQQNGLRNITDLFYVDGMPAMEYIGKLYPGREFDPEKELKDDWLIRAELLSAALSGTHRLEAVTLGLDEKGAYQVGVKQIKLDMTEFDKGYKFYQTKPSAMVDKLFKNDKEKDARHEAIRADFSQKLAAGITRNMNQKEAEAFQKAKEAEGPAFEFDAEDFEQRFEQNKEAGPLEIDLDSIMDGVSLEDEFEAEMAKTAETWGKQRAEKKTVKLDPELEALFADLEKKPAEKGSAEKEVKADVKKPERMSFKELQGNYAKPERKPRVQIGQHEKKQEKSKGREIR